MLVTDTALVHSLGLLVRGGQTRDLGHVLPVTLHILYRYARARALRNRVSKAAQLVNVQITQVNAGFGLPSDSIVRLLDHFLLNFFFWVARSGDRVEFGVKTAVRYTVVLYFHQILQVVVFGGTLDQNGAPCDLNHAVVLDVDFARKALQRGLVSVTEVLVGVLSRQLYLVLMLVQR